MTRRTNNLKNMYSAVKAVILTYIAIWTGYVPFETANAAFNASTDEIEDTEEIQKMLIKGYTIEKRVKKKKMATAALMVCKKVRAYASSIKNNALMGEMKISMSKLLYSASNLSLTYANNILTAATAMTAADRTLFDITAADMNTLSDSIKEFEAVISMPRDRIVVRKTATKKLPELFAETTGILTNQLDNLMSNYESSHPDFYSDYFNARVIVDMQRHTVLKGNVTNEDGEDLKKVKVTIKGKNKITNAELVVFEEMTNADGNFVKSTLNPELDYDVIFELPHYEKVVLTDLDIKKGEHELLAITLKKLV